MNGKFEDKLIRLAFGETNPKESSALERQAKSDPDAMRALAEYRKVRIGLNLLNDIPPDQLSKERLRDAILGQGLKPIPAPDSARWGWAWMPATAFALIFGFLSLRHMSTPVSALKADDANVVASLDRIKRPSEDLSPIHPLSSVMTPMSVPKAKSRNEHLVSRRHKTTTASRRAILRHDMSNDAKFADQVVYMLRPANTIQEPQVEKPDTSALADNQTASAGVNTPMVVINPEIDNNSGAQKATEVDGANNVVVGG